MNYHLIMELNSHSVLILLMSFVWAFQILKIVFTQKGGTWKAIINLVASACLVVGAIGSFGPSLSANAGLSYPNKFEWPIGKTDSALKHPSGLFVVSHQPTGRIQIYDENLNFIRGWSVKTGRGIFQLHPLDESTFYAYVARGSMRYQFDLNGTLVSSYKYDDSYPYPEKSNQLISVTIPTPVYLLLFAYPSLSFFVGACGMFLLFATGEIRVGKN